MMWLQFKYFVDKYSSAVLIGWNYFTIWWIDEIKNFMQNVTFLKAKDIVHWQRNFFLTNGTILQTIFNVLA